MTEAEVEAINADASVLMKRGIAFWTNRGARRPSTRCTASTKRWSSGAGCRRITRRFRCYLLAACLLNRADALAAHERRGPAGSGTRSYDEGIAVLQRIPLAEDPRYPRRLAMAFQNRGLALQARGREGDGACAAASFADALDVLDHEYSRASRIAITSGRSCG